MPVRPPRVYIRRYNTTQVRIEAPATGYKARDGELFFDPESRTLRMGNGVSTGGVILAGATGDVSSQLVNGMATFSLQTDGDVVLEGTLRDTNGADLLAGSGSSFNQDLNTTDNVEFNQVRVGNATTAAQFNTVAGGATGPVFIYNENWTGYKLIIVTEAMINNVKHTQVAEATIAAIYNASDEPVMSVFGVVSTTGSPMATFTVARNLTNIEVSAVNAQQNDTIYVHVHAVSFGSYFD